MSLIWGRSRLAAHWGSQMHTLQDACQSGPRGWDTDGVKFSLLTADAELTALQQTPKVIVRCSFVEENDLRLSEAQTVTWGLKTAASAVLLYTSLLKISPQILCFIFKPTTESINWEVGPRQTWVPCWRLNHNWRTVSWRSGWKKPWQPKFCTCFRQTKQPVCAEGGPGQ